MYGHGSRMFQGPMISKPVECAGVEAEGGEGYKDNSK
jgi:hypothetical protein